MKKLIFLLLGLIMQIATLHAQQLVDDDIYHYTDLTHEQVAKINQIGREFNRKVNSAKDQRVYLMSIVKQQTAIDSVLTPDQQKKYQHYKKMKGATNWLKQKVSLTKEQQDKMASVCFAIYDKMDALSYDKSINSQEKKIQAGKLMNELSTSLQAVLTPAQKAQLEKAKSVPKKEKD